MNLAQVLTRVSANVTELPSNVQHNIEAYVQSAALQLQLMHNFQCMMAEKQYITPAQSPQTHVLGPIPATWKEPRGNPYYVLAIGTTRGLLWQPSREYTYREYPPSDPNSVGAPRRLFLSEATNDTMPDPANPDYNLTSRNIEVYPYPDGSSDWSDGNYRIRVPYWQYIPIPTSSSDSNWFTVNAIEFLVSAATAMCYEQDGDFRSAQYWFGRTWGPNWDGASVKTLGGAARRVLNLDKSIVGMPSKTLTPRRDVHGPRDQWRQ